MAVSDRKAKLALIDPTSDSLPLSRQAELLSISRSSYYYEPKIDPEEEAIKRRIDEIYTFHPYLGSRRIRILLHRAGYVLGRHQVMGLMRSMGIKALYPKKHTSIPNKEHMKYPYLLRNVEIRKPDQVWATDITYIRLKRGWIYLVAIIDWYSRKVLAWRISAVMDAKFCTGALCDALERGKFENRKPEIFNTDQGSQFTSLEFTSILESHEIRISMDGKGRYADNILTERLWRTVKYEEIYLKDYANPLEAMENLREYFRFYNTERPHQSLGYRTPDEVYYESLHQTPTSTHNLNLILP